MAVSRHSINTHGLKKKKKRTRMRNTRRSKHRPSLTMCPKYNLSRFIFFFLYFKYFFPQMNTKFKYP